MSETLGLHYKWMLAKSKALCYTEANTDAEDGLRAFRAQRERKQAAAT